MLDDDEVDAVPLGLGLGILARVALANIGDLDALAGGRLHGGGEALDLGAVLCVGRRDVQRQEMPQRIDRGMELRSLLAPSP